MNFIAASVCLLGCDEQAIGDENFGTAWGMEEVNKARVLEAAKANAPVFHPPRGGLLSNSDKGPELKDDFLKQLIDGRTDETSRTWVKVGAGLVLLGVIGSIGTFSRLARKSFSSGIGTGLAAVGGGPSSLTPLALAEKQAQAAILRDRVNTLKLRLKERHPLWYPGDAMP